RLHDSERFLYAQFFRPLHKPHAANRSRTVQEYDLIRAGYRRKRLREIFDRKALVRQHDDLYISERFFNIRRDIRKFDEFLIHPVIEYNAPPFSDSFKIPGKLRRLIKGHREPSVGDRKSVV